jgi:hypothetical protein
MRIIQQALGEFKEKRFAKRAVSDRSKIDLPHPRGYNHPLVSETWLM